MVRRLRWLENPRTIFWLICSGVVKPSSVRSKPDWADDCLVGVVGYWFMMSRLRWVGLREERGRDQGLGIEENREFGRDMKKRVRARTRWKGEDERGFPKVDVR